MGVNGISPDLSQEILKYDRDTDITKSLWDSRQSSDWRLTWDYLLFTEAVNSTHLTLTMLWATVLAMSAKGTLLLYTFPFVS